MIRTFHDGRAGMHHGDSRDVLKTLADASVDSVVCDPPYALVSIVKRFGSKGAKPAKEASGAYARASAGFMGQEWDTGETAFAVEFWAEVFRVLKPGGHVVAFSGTRTYHRLAVAIEDAGFEIRDQLAWVYGTGFPKSHNVAKGIDKRRVEDREPIRRVCRFIRAGMEAKGFKSKHLVGSFEGCHSRLIDHWAARDTDSQPSLPTAPQFARLKEVLALGDEMDADFARLDGRKGEAGDTWNEAEVVGDYGKPVAGGFSGERFTARDSLIRRASDLALQWEGWGTALKPGWEPIVLARKPMIGTVVENVLAHGTGALNIGACRIEAQGVDLGRNNGARTSGTSYVVQREAMRIDNSGDLGRYPANLLHDGSPEVLANFPESKSGGITHQPRRSGFGFDDARDGGTHVQRPPDSGSAARFFYCAKASKRDRAGSKHPTVKPIAVMRWLVRLVTPPGGVVLEPFAGSGSTLAACLDEGARVIGIERDEAFFADCCRRLDEHDGERKPIPSARMIEAEAEADPEPVECLPAPPPVLALPAPAKLPRKLRAPAFAYPSFLEAAE